MTTKLRIKNISDDTNSGRVINFLQSKYKLRLNEIKKRVEVSKISSDNWTQVRELDLLSDYNLHNKDKREVSRAFFQNVIGSSYCSVPFDPLLDYFNSLNNSRKSYSDATRTLTNYITLVDEAHRVRLCSFFKKWGVSAVKTVFEKRHFNKRCLVFQGKSDTYKTSFCRHLIPPKLEDYMTENPAVAKGNIKDAKFALSRNLIILFDELDGYNTTHRAHMKHYMTMNHVNERMPYDRVETQVPRIASFLATCNRNDFLRDETGDCRFIVFEIAAIDKSYRDFDVNDFWAQCYKLYKEGFDCELTREELDENRLNNEGFRFNSAEYEILVKYFRKPEQGEDCDFMTSTEICAHLNSMESADGIKILPRALGRALVRGGFVKTKKGRGNESRYGYFVKKLPQPSENLDENFTPF